MPSLAAPSCGERRRKPKAGELLDVELMFGDVP
jgi:hypothetical protein